MCPYLDIVIIMLRPENNKKIKKKKKIYIIHTHTHTMLLHSMTSTSTIVFYTNLYKMGISCVTQVLNLVVFTDGPLS